MADAVSSPSKRFGTRERLILLVLGTLLLGMVAFQRFVLRGLVFPIRVVEGSMAPSLLGDHYHVSCAECGKTFNVDVVLTSDLTLACARCGHHFAIEDESRRAGDRVVINRWNALTDRVRRWDMIAARDPLQPGRFVVKRVVALPNEAVSIAHGNVIIDGRIATKSLSQFRDVAITVADERYVRNGKAKSNWVVSGEASPWRDDAGSWSFDSSAMPTQERRWLVFRPPGIPSAQPSRVLDNYSYNQSVSRKLNAVNDLLVRCEFGDVDCKEVCFRFDQPNRSWLITLDVGRGEVCLESDGRPVMTHRLQRQPPTIAELATCDGRILFGLDGICQLIHQDRELLVPESPVVSVGARSGRLRVNRLLVARDIFYLPLRGNPGGVEASVRLAADQFFLLGDNSPISIDSRDPRYGPISASQLMGTVTRRSRHHD